MSKSSFKVFNVVISQGDEDSIAPELIAKTLANINYKRIKIFIVAATRAKDLIIKNCKRIDFNFSKQLDNGINFISPFEINVPVSYKKDNALSSIYTACNFILMKKADFLVTAPINKHKIAKTVKNFSGHTGFLKYLSKSKSTLMLMSTPSIKVAIQTEHIPLNIVSKSLKKEKLIQSLVLLADYAYRKKLKNICVLALNPHAGDAGLIGSEEKEILEPVINSFKYKNIKIYGPYPADSAFTPENREYFKVFLSLYHDQGMIPVKYEGFDNVVNVTLGLPFIRTSPGHGTAYEIVNKGIASSLSMENAIKEGINLYNTYAKLY